MPFEKGHKPYPDAGRKPGVKNKRTQAEDACYKLGINPFEMLARMCMEAENESNRLSAISTLCKHIEPPRKPLDVALDPEANVINVIVRDFSKE